MQVASRLSFGDYLCQPVESSHQAYVLNVYLLNNAAPNIFRTVEWHHTTQAMMLRIASEVHGEGQWAK